MNTLFVLCGPTAAGKSDLALELAHACGAEIVSADSMQVYRGLDIGTAKPPSKVRATIPHHLIDIVDIHETFSAGQFVHAADCAIRDIASRGRRVLVCGGTMLYLRALFRGLVPTPSNPALRAELLREPTAALYARLKACDQASGSQLHMNDRVRIVRALEITLTTGTPASRLREQHAFRDRRHQARIVALVPARDELDRRIDARIATMMRSGLLQETRWLVDHLPSGEIAPPLRAVGYRQLSDHLAGHCSLDEAVAAIHVATRHFARRQLSWIRADSEIRVTSTAAEARARLLEAT